MVSHPYADWSHRLIVVEKEGGCGQRPTLRIVVNPLKKEIVLIGVPLRLLRVLDVLKKRTDSYTCATAQTRRI